MKIKTKEENVFFDEIEPVYVLPGEFALSRF